jgi:hypothetical protein
MANIMSYHTPRGLTPQAQGTGPCSLQDTAFQVCLQCPGHELDGSVSIVNSNQDCDRT